MRILVILGVCAYIFFAYGCSSDKVASSTNYNGTQDLTLDKNIHPMSRNEVILAVQECESSGLRAAMVFSKRKISSYTSDVVVDVTCVPRYR
jgi:monomeric isocitrate dehydrogenase